MKRKIITLFVLTMTLISLLVYFCNEYLKIDILSYLSNDVDTCDISGFRKANAKIDIGVDTKKITRNYYGYTNEYSQLVKVTADKLILQTKEEGIYDGRYCQDEAKVSGTEKKDYDEGHVIADSLGGASNAYNITPQKSNVNRKGGKQYELEEKFRNILANGGEITNLNVDIIYDNKVTQTPSKYIFSWVENGNQRNEEFLNQ